MSRKTHIHEIKAFAAFSNRGHLIYDTIKPTQAQARAAYERHNPKVKGYEDMHKAYFEVLPVYIGIDKGFQYDLEDTIKEKATRTP